MFYAALEHSNTVLKEGASVLAAVGRTGHYSMFGG